MAKTAEKATHMPRSRKQKSQDILTAAAKIFVRDGFEKAHMDEIAENACVSKQTIYSNFGSKDHLFNEIISDIFKELQKETFQQPKTDCPRDLLETFLKKMMQPLYSKKGVALYRLAIYEGVHNPKLNQIFISRIERGITRLATILEKLQGDNIIQIEDAHKSAHDLIYACKGLPHSKLLCGFEKSINQEEISFLAKRQATIFLEQNGFHTPKNT
jgi:AcrR family transcriptional regulator